MPKDSCINHPSRGDFIILRRHMVDLCRGDHCAAAVLAFFEYATNGELDRFSRAGVQRLPWVTTTLKSISEETVSLYSPRRIEDRIAWLEATEILQVDQRGGRTNRYLLNVDLLNEYIAQGKTIPPKPEEDGGEGTDSGGSTGDNSDKTTWVPTTNDAGTHDKCRRYPRQMSPVYNKVLRRSLEEEEEEYPPTPLSQTSPQDTDPDPTDGLDLEDEVLTFVENAYRRENRRAKLDRLWTRAAEPLRENIRRAETEYGAAEFRSALLAYLSDDSDWLREHRWPIRTFLAQVEDYLPNAVSRPQCCASRCAGEAEGASLVGNQHPGPENGFTGLKIANSLPYAAQEWNRVVTAGPPVEQWTRRDRGLAVDDPEFIAALPGVLALCQKAFETQLAEDVAWLNFRYLLRKGKGCDVENWYRMANGEFNWLRAKRKENRSRSSELNDFYERERQETYEQIAKLEQQERLKREGNL